MSEMLIKTLWMRPYVLLFLISFVAISWANRGAKRTLLLLLLGLSIAYISEWTSIRWGIPYGDYYYIYSAMQGELIIGGVPIWDSISYVFLAYASYETIAYLNWKPRILLAAIVMMMADMVIDPIAVRGDQWFLGKVFFYPEGGIYFGVPISNFVGWFLVGYAILFSYDHLCTRWFHKPAPMRAPQFGPLFYYGILCFISVVGLFIGEYVIVLCSLALHGPILWSLSRRYRRLKIAN